MDKVCKERFEKKDVITIKTKENKQVHFKSLEDEVFLKI